MATGQDQRPSESGVHRRRLLSGGVLGLVAGLFARGGSAAAADGDPVRLGKDNFASLPTSITVQATQSPSSPQNMLRVVSRAGAAIVGWTGDPSSNSDANTDISSPGPELGSLVIAGAATAREVSFGEPAGGNFVAAGLSKTALRAINLAGGLALDVRGRSRFATAGCVTFPAGVSSLMVFDPAVTERSIILATFQGDPGNAVLTGIQCKPGQGFIAQTSHRMRTATELGYMVIEKMPGTS